MARRQKDKESPVPEWRDGYVSYRPLLYKALGRLAKQGYSLEPSEAPELIHDFLSEAWQGLTNRFDPELASFSTYLYGAFIQYARRRIVKTLKWRDSLISLEELALVIGSDSNDLELRNDLKLTKQVLSRLPNETIKILEILTSEGYRERSAASSFGLSRYHFRRIAIDALAQFAIELDMSEFVPQKDWPIAYALWGEGRNIEDAAAKVGMSIQRARTVRKRILKSIETILSNLKSKSTIKKGKKSVNLCEFWKKFIANPSDKKSLAILTRRTDELLEHLQDCETCEIHNKVLEDNLPAFYEAIGSVIELEDEQLDIEEYEQANIDDNRRVSAAIENALLPAIPYQVGALLRSKLKPQEYFYLFLACEALSMRIHRHALHEGGNDFLLGKEGLRFVISEENKIIRKSLPRETIINEINAFVATNEYMVSFLFDWIIDASRSFPKLMIGIEAKPHRLRGLSLKLFDRDPTVNLYDYWSPESTPQHLNIGAGFSTGDKKHRFEKYQEKQAAFGFGPSKKLRVRVYPERGFKKVFTRKFVHGTELSFDLKRPPKKKLPQIKVKSGAVHHNIEVLDSVGEAIKVVDKVIINTLRANAKRRSVFGLRRKRQSPRSRRLRAGGSKWRR